MPIATSAWRSEHGATGNTASTTPECAPARGWPGFRYLNQWGRLRGGQTRLTIAVCCCNEVRGLTRNSASTIRDLCITILCKTRSQSCSFPNRSALLLSGQASLPDEKLGGHTRSNRGYLDSTVEERRDHLVVSTLICDQQIDGLGRTNEPFGNDP